MTIQDQVIGALCLWRENRGGGTAGMASIMCVLMNRATKHKTSVYVEATKRWQFSSMTALGDPNLILFPAENDLQWGIALTIASEAAKGNLVELTNGATLYYNPKSIVTDKTITLPTGETIPFPAGWNPKVVTYTVTVAGHYFFKE